MQPNKDALKAIKEAKALALSASGCEYATARNGDILSNIDNAVRVLEHHPELQGKIWYDEFLQSIMTDWQGKKRKWADRDTSLLTVYMQRHIGLNRVGTALVHEAVLCAAFNNTRNEVREYLEGLEWDGKERLPTLLPVAFGTEDNTYSSAVGRCWFVSMVARVMRPGCQVDTVPVFEGEQGIKKSSALRVIGGEWFTESHESVTGKDFFEVMQGNLLVEISEMHGFSKAEVTRIKGVISNRFDRYRKPYGRLTQDHPRQCVFACTTNENEWQKDDTGARRFWPIACTVIDLEWLAANRDQLFAEAMHRFNADESWWDVPADEQEREVNARRASDVWEPAFSDYTALKSQVRIGDLLSNVLHLPLADQDVPAQMRAGRVLRKLGWEKKNRRVGGVQSTVWEPGK